MGRATSLSPFFSDSCQQKNDLIRQTAHIKKKSVDFIDNRSILIPITVTAYRSPMFLIPPVVNVG